MPKVRGAGQGARNQTTTPKKCDHNNLWKTTDVVDSRDRGEYYYRRRKCKVCGMSFRTEERLMVEKPKAPKEVKPVKKRGRPRKQFSYSQRSIDLMSDQELENAMMSGRVKFDEDEW